MKTLILIPCILTTLSGVTRGARKPFVDMTVSPLYASGDSTLVVHSGTVGLSFALYISNDKYSEQCVLIETIKTAGTSEYDFPNTYTRSTNTMFIRYKSSNATSMTETQHFQRNLAKGKYQYITDNQSISSNNQLAVVTSNGSYSFKNMTYGFQGFDGIYVPSFYHKIDLSEFKITVISTYKPFFYCEPSLVIKNYNGIFDGITGASETATFPLSLKEVTGGYTFQFRKATYVDPETLKMYSSSRTGCVKTKHIYFPINEMQNQDQIECYLLLQNFGIDHDTLIHNFTFHALRNTFGDCSNSKYCITREAK